jgi:hypothetical protein
LVHARDVLHQRAAAAHAPAVTHRTTAAAVSWRQRIMRASPRRADERKRHVDSAVACALLLLLLFCTSSGGRRCGCGERATQRRRERALRGLHRKGRALSLSLAVPSAQKSKVPMLPHIK